MSTHFDQLKTMLDCFCAVWQTNDGSGLGSHFTEDGSLINPFGERASGRAAVAAMYTQYFGGMLRGTSTTVNVKNVHAIENNHAFVDGDQTITGPDGSVVMVVHLAALMRREGGGGRFVDARPFSYATPPA